MTAYYNDNDTDVCAWLRELIRAGLLPDGEVDERSILDVAPADLRGFTQCHFFAGIGGWAYALRLAGVPDDVNVWTGSPPCQPFSSAGLRKGANDERHLAPKFASLVGACRPGLLFGEQVASAAVFGKAAKRARSAAEEQPEWAWIDDLSDRLEAARYAVGTSDIPVAGIGGYHIRQRTFFCGVAEGVADGIVKGLERQPRHGDRRDEPGWVNADEARSATARSGPCGMADTDGRERARFAEFRGTERDGQNPERPEGIGGAAPRSDFRRLADAEREQRVGWRSSEAVHEPRPLERAERLRDNGGLADDNGGDAGAEREQRGGEHGQQPQDSSAGGVADTSSGRRRKERENAHGLPHGDREEGRAAGPSASDSDHRPCTLDGIWRSPDWLFCRDGKWRPVESGTFPLAHGVPARVVRLRGYGNAISPQVAATFIESSLQAIHDIRLNDVSGMTPDEGVFG